MSKTKTAYYKRITAPGGTRYQFFCDLTGALLCTTKPYCEKTEEESLAAAWEKEGKACFNRCQKCGNWVIDAMFNADALECVACAPWENTPKYCKFCGEKVSPRDTVCPKCKKLLIYGGSNDES